MLKMDSHIHSEYSQSAITIPLMELPKFYVKQGTQIYLPFHLLKFLQHMAIFLVLGVRKTYLVTYHRKILLTEFMIWVGLQ